MVEGHWRRGTGLMLVGLGLVVAVATRAGAVYLDQDQNVSFRARVYSQGSVRVEDTILGVAPGTEVDTTPQVKSGQLIQHRNFYNPEIDAKITGSTAWMRDTFLRGLVPDELTARVASWGFYDGLYDYGTDQFGERARVTNPNFGSFSGGVCSGGANTIDKGKPCSSNAECSSGQCGPRGAWFLKGTRLHEPSGCPGNSTTCLVDSLEKVFPDYEVRDVRGTYAVQNRINELYLSYSKGPVFFRVGKQAISWGESDTIALLDQNNPFDLTLGAPGLFEDLDEARIPLWTVRASYSLQPWRAMSSGFLEAYWVPGEIDTYTGELPMLAASPYSPRGKDPQFSSGFPNDTYQFVLFDHQPEQKFSNSRYGFRLQTVLNGEYTVQGWMYTTFPSSPVPRHIAPVIIRPGTQGTRLSPPAPQCDIFSRQGCSPLFAVETVHELTQVFGLAGSFFVAPIDSILRLESEFFHDEPGFIPQYNLNIKSDADRKNGIGVPGADSVGDPGTVPKADIMRWEVGLDRFFFFRPLNPTNSFTLVAAQVGQWNTSETSRRDFRAGGQRRIGSDIPGSNPVPNDFVQQNAVEAFFQATLITDYMHGRLEPQITYIQDVRGTYAVHPQVTYRWTDWLLFRLEYINIGGAYQGLGYFKDRDQLSMRVTYQLN